MRDNILEIKNMHTYFFTDNGTVKSVDGVDIELERGKTLGIVGESGSGKSVTALSLMGLLTGTTGKVVEGEILLDGQDILKMSDEERRKMRGKDIAMVFQEPMTSLNPVMKIGAQVMENITLHQNVSKEQAKQLTIDILKKTGLPRVERIVNEYPFQLSGGQRQRVMIAMALVCNPNGKRMSEFMLNSYTAAMRDVPVLFLSGDQGICREAQEMVPAITTVSTKSGCGASTINEAPETVIQMLKEKTKEALAKDFSTCKIDLPAAFDYEANYKDLKKAYRMSFYPGVEKADERTNKLHAENYMDILVAHSFLVY